MYTRHDPHFNAGIGELYGTINILLVVDQAGDSDTGPYGSSIASAPNRTDIFIICTKFLNNFALPYGARRRPVRIASQDAPVSPPWLKDPL